jgi:predicted GNAT family N-acyltransferase
MNWTFEDFDRKYDRSKFDCGNSVLSNYLKNQIAQDVARKANVPLVSVNSEHEVIGFYTLSSSAVSFASFPSRLKKKIAPYPVSVARIGRLAVDNSSKGFGLGRELLFHAIDRVEQISTKIGIRAIIVDAIDPNAEKFYLKYGFEYLQNSNEARKTLYLIL